MRKLIAPFLACFVFALFSCASNPPATPDPLPETDAAEKPATDETAAVGPIEETPGPETPQEDGEIVAKFDNVTITKETFKTTKTELETVVNDLNRVTFSRDYARWLTFLSEDYLKTFSDPAVLAEVSANLPIKGVQLKSIRDYFNYVFVPSRQNMRVDDIQFVSPTRVYVIMEISPGNPAAIYIIEKFGEQWKLVPKNQ